MRSLTYKLLTILLFIFISGTVLAHEYDHPEIFDVDKGWMMYKGDISSDSLKSESLLWQPLAYDGRVLLPEDLQEGEIIWLRVSLPEKKIIDPVVLFEEMLPDYEIYYRDNLLFSDGSIEHEEKQIFFGDERRIIPLGKLQNGEPLYFRIKINIDPMMRIIEKVHIGNHANLITSFLDSDLKYVILGFFFLFSSIIPLITYFKFRKSRENAALSLLTISFGILTLSESVFLEMWLGSAKLLFYIVEPSPFLGAISLCLYFEAIFGPGWKSNLKILRYTNIGLLIIVLPLLTLLQPPVAIWLSIKLFFFVEFFIIIMSTSVIGVINARKGNKAARIIIIGYSALSVFGALDILGGVFYLFPWSPAWYPWGILMLVLVLQYNTQYSLKKYSSDLESSRSQLIESRFETLKNQINPHFLFNSLNTLSSLIFIDREQAATFVRDLSKVYRFILETRDKERIALDEELTILEAYIYLVQTRFKESLKINLEKMGNKNKEIAPLCLQMLIENAIKHNVTSKVKRLTIDIFFESDNYIVVENNLQPKSTKEFSSKIGLKNITNRYSYLTKLPVIIEETNEKFTVKVPLI